jgi:hypothetical protein
MRALWQKSNVRCHFCHWWQDPAGRRINAMNSFDTVLQVLLLVAALIGLLAGLAATLRHDGYGHRPAPRSHRGQGSPWNPHAA